MASIQKSEMVVRQAFKKLMIGTGSLIVRESVKNPITKVTELKEINKGNFPCRVSFGSGASEQGKATQSIKEVKLFTEHDLEIPEGSKVQVVQNGVMVELTNTGIPAIYNTHREYPMKEWVRWQ